MPGLLIDKLCNAFLPDAAPSGHLPEAVPGAVRQAHKRTGGLIVVVEHARGEFRFRCFGATRVAQVLSSRVKGT
jgi:hypothetical protein